MSEITRLKSNWQEDLGLNEWGERVIVEGTMEDEIIETNQLFGVAGIDAAKIKNLVVDNIAAITGTIGAFEIGADYIRDAANSFGLASTVSGGDDVRFWAGATFANRATAPFRVTEAGVVTATDIQISTASSTIAGAALINSRTASTIQVRAESFYRDDFFFVGSAVDGFTETAASGSVTRTPLSTVLQTGGAQFNSSRINSSLLLRTVDESVVIFGEITSWELGVQAELSGTTAINVFLGLIQDATSPPLDGTSTFTGEHIMFMWDDTALYCSVADGTTQSKSADVASGITATDTNEYRIEADGSSAARFYVNDTLIDTRSSNLPTTGDVAAHFQVETDAAAGKTVHIKNNYTIKATI